MVNEHLAQVLAQDETLTFNAQDSQLLEDFLQKHPSITAGRVLPSGYVPLYLPESQVETLYAGLGNRQTLFPVILSPLDAESNLASGVTPLLEHPYLDLSGAGVIVGFVDTGIDYRKDVFRYEDGSSKILGIWDQTLTGTRAEGLYYGASYTQADINEALASDYPLERVPTRDSDGHGTFLASVAVGRETEDSIGTAPDAQLLVVKLRRANPYFIEKLLLPPDKPNYFHNADVMLGIQYLVDSAKRLGKPLVICLALGSNDTGHDGNTLMEQYLSYLAQESGLAVVTGAGNESNQKHHTQGKLARSGATSSIALRVGVPEASFSINLYTAPYDKISVGLRSPSGEVLSRIPFQTDTVAEETLLFEQTTVSVRYYRNTNTSVRLGFSAAKEGVWEILLYGDAIALGDYHAWLPISYQVSPDVGFLEAVSAYTIVYPANALRVITAGAYDSQTGSLYVASSWGPTRLPRVAPDFVAPGVKVQGVYALGTGTMTGTSVSAAITAGASAILMQWGIVQGNLPAMDGDVVRQLLIGGCERSGDEVYPNKQWGYGRLNLYQSFRRLRTGGT